MHYTVIYIHICIPIFMQSHADLRNTRVFVCMNMCVRVHVNSLFMLLRCPPTVICNFHMPHLHTRTPTHMYACECCTNAFITIFLAGSHAFDCGWLCKRGIIVLEMQFLCIFKSHFLKISTKFCVSLLRIERSKPQKYYICVHCNCHIQLLHALKRIQY